MATSSEKSCKPVRTQCPGLDHEIAERDGGPPGPNTSCGRRKDLPEDPRRVSGGDGQDTDSWHHKFSVGSLVGPGSCSAVSGPWLEGAPSFPLDLNADRSDLAHFASEF